MDIGLEHLTHDAFSRLYSPELALLMRRMYDATVIGRGLQRETFGVRRLFALVVGEPTEVASNTSRDRALLVYLQLPVGGPQQFFISSAQGPGGGGSDFVGSGGQNPFTFGTKQFVLRPSDALWVTQRIGPRALVRTSSEYF